TEYQSTSVRDHLWPSKYSYDYPVDRYNKTSDYWSKDRLQVEPYLQRRNTIDYSPPEYSSLSNWYQNISPRSYSHDYPLNRYSTRYDYWNRDYSKERPST